MITLEDTIGLMCSEDYKDRLKAEYLQLKIRINKAQKSFAEMERQAQINYNGSLLKIQISDMMDYETVLRLRMAQEGIPVDQIDLLFWEE